MPHVTFVTPEGEREIAYNPGDVLMTVAVRNMIAGIEAQCGGSCACGTCLVEPDAAARMRLVAKSEGEAEMLDAVAEDRPDARLSCQIRLDATHDGMRFVVIEPDL